MGGPAIITVNASHSVSTDPTCLFCTGAGESAQLGPQTIKLWTAPGTLLVRGPWP
jgi:hypothetical protein